MGSLLKLPPAFRVGCKRVPKDPSAALPSSLCRAAFAVGAAAVAPLLAAAGRAGSPEGRGGEGREGECLAGISLGPASSPFLSACSLSSDF